MLFLYYCGGVGVEVGVETEPQTPGPQAAVVQRLPLAICLLHSA